MSHVNLKSLGSGEFLQLKHILTISQSNALINSYIGQSFQAPFIFPQQDYRHTTVTMCLSYLHTFFDYFAIGKSRSWLEHVRQEA